VNPAAAPADRWIRVCPGEYTVGSPEDEQLRYPDEPRRQVTLTRAFLVQAVEVTQAQWTELFSPAGFLSCGADCPVENVSWFEAIAYCNARSLADELPPCYRRAGQLDEPYDSTDARQGAAPAWPEGPGCRGYRLPTEAEWEVAARAGDLRATYRGNLDAQHLQCEVENPTLDPIAWFCGNAEVYYPDCVDITSEGGIGCAGPHPGGMKAANAWGLFDMLGNIWEWCWDRHGESLRGGVDPLGDTLAEARSYRGGSWNDRAYHSRAACRSGAPPASKGLNLGLRVVRTDS